MTNFLHTGDQTVTGSAHNNFMRYAFEGQSQGEEIANSVTHGIGATLAIAATAVLTVVAATGEDPIKLVSFAVFGFTLFTLYLVSTLYHGIRNHTAKRVFHIFDHSAIFLLIAGTYTPVTLVAIGGTLGWSLFGVIWGLAILGMTITAIWFERARYFSLALYIAMGWLIVLTGPRLWLAFKPVSIVWLIAGGLLYTGGTLFYRAKSLRYQHMIWHLFVIGGSICHVFMMMTL